MILVGQLVIAGLWLAILWIVIREVRLYRAWRRSLALPPKTRWLVRCAKAGRILRVL